jgi:flagellar assembly factor FliW
MTDTDAKISFFSARFGDLEIPLSKIIILPEGIIGFPDSTRFALLDPSDGSSVFLWLQAVDNPDLAFIITNPLLFVPDYILDLSEPDIQRLDIAGKSPPALFSIVTVPPNDPDNVSINLLAPLLYFESENTLYQIVLEIADWPLKYKLLESEDSDSEGGSQESGRVGGDG